MVMPNAAIQLLRGCPWNWRPSMVIGIFEVGIGRRLLRCGKQTCPCNQWLLGKYSASGRKPVVKREVYGVFDHRACAGDGI